MSRKKKVREAAASYLATNKTPEGERFATVRGDATTRFRFLIDFCGWHLRKLDRETVEWCMEKAGLA